jgi:hypothetical protein
MAVRWIIPVTGIYVWLDARYPTAALYGKRVMHVMSQTRTKREIAEMYRIFLQISLCFDVSLSVEKFGFVNSTNLRARTNISIEDSSRKYYIFLPCDNIGMIFQDRFAIRLL